MNKQTYIHTYKVICIFLAVLLIFLTFSAEIFAEEACNCDTAPIIMIKGRGAIVENKDDINSKEIGTFDFNLLQKELPSLATSYYHCCITDDFSSFSEKLSAFLKEMYAGYQLDENGNVTNNSGRDPSLRWEERLYETKSEHLTEDEWLKYRVTPKHVVKHTGKVEDNAYLLYKYTYYFDCRLDFWETADDLDKYIRYIKELTGHDKVKIVCRCLGTTVFATYLSKYGYDDIESVMFYNSLYNGSVVADNIYTGNLYLDADSIDNFTSANLDENIILTVLAQIVSLANSAYGLKTTTAYLNKTLKEVGEQVLADALLATYATCPGYWTMVSYEKYDEAIDYVFKDNKDKYKGLIERLDNYHENVAANINDIIRQMGNDGVDVYYIAKYNSQVYPVVSEAYASVNGDNVISVVQQVPGTVAANIGEELDETYICEKIEQGLGKYISYDNCIDASGSMFPDTTWYIKDLEHNEYPAVVDLFILTIMLSNGDYTIYSDPNYPQYLTSEKMSDDTIQLHPLGAEYPGKSYAYRSFFDILKYIFTLIFDFLIFWK